MTIKEALRAKSENLAVSDGKIELVLIESNLDGTSVYDPEVGAKDLDMAYKTLLLESISIVEKKEDDVSVKYSDNLKEIVSAICRKWGLPDPFEKPKPTVKQVMIW